MKCFNFFKNYIQRLLYLLILSFTFLCVFSNFSKVHAQTTTPHKVTDFPKLISPLTDTDNLYTGYLQLKNNSRRRLFYWFVESKKDKDNAPLVIFSNGGPGCASTISFFEGIGPIRILNSDLLDINPYGWNKEFNLLFIDHPAGVGLSQIKNLSSYSDIDSYASSSKETMIDYADALNVFLEIPLFSNLKNRETILAGESYAGKYIPWLLHLYDTKQVNIPLKITGVLIGNGSLDPYIQYGTLARHARALGITSYAETVKLKSQLEACRNDMKTKKFDDKENNCGPIVGAILSYGGELNPYDVRKTKEEMSYRADLAKYFNTVDDLNKLGIIKFNREVGNYYRFHRCVVHIRNKFIKELYEPLPDDVFKTLLSKDKYNVLLFSGIYDLRVETLGTQEFLRIYPWVHREAFKSQPPIQFKLKDDDIPKGHFKSAGKVTFFGIYGGTHHTAQYEPQTYLEMARRFIINKTLCPDKGDCRTTDQLSCANGCSNNGDCDGLSCKCNQDYFGVDCSLYQKDFVQNKKYRGKITGEDALIYQFYYTPTTSTFDLDLSLKRDSLSGIPFVMVNITLDDGSYYPFNQKTLLLQKMNYNRNGVSSTDTGFQYSNTTLAESKILNIRDVSVKISKKYIITVGIYNDDPSELIFSYNVNITPASSRLSIFWVYITLIVSLGSIITVQIYMLLNGFKAPIPKRYKPYYAPVKENNESINNVDLIDQVPEDAPTDEDEELFSVEKNIVIRR